MESTQIKDASGREISVGDVVRFAKGRGGPNELPGATATVRAQVSRTCVETNLPLTGKITNGRNTGIPVHLACLLEVVG